MSYKMYCVVSLEAVKKMGGNRGKMMAQAGHAFLHAWWDALENYPEDAVAYRDSTHARKITVAVETEEELRRLEERYERICGVSLVKDAGFTVFSEPTVTCLGIGPIEATKVGEDLKALKVFM